MAWQHFVLNLFVEMSMDIFGCILYMFAECISVYSFVLNQYIFPTLPLIKHNRLSHNQIDGQNFDIPWTIIHPFIWKIMDHTYIIWVYQGEPYDAPIVGEPELYHLDQLGQTGEADLA
jgi:hypothetical protein